jgi:hypothetical protein
MDNPRRARVVEQHFLNLPGFHAGAYVRAYVEDTSERAVARPDKSHPTHVIPRPRIVLEISDCYRRIELDFDISSAEGRLNSFHKIETLSTALATFRDGLAAEAALHRRREGCVADQGAGSMGPAAPTRTAPRRRPS